MNKCGAVALLGYLGAKQLKLALSFLICNDHVQWNQPSQVSHGADGSADGQGLQVDSRAR